MPCGAALIGWLGPVWAKSQGLTEAVGLLWCLDLTSTMMARWNTDCGTGQLLLYGESSSSSPAIWWISRASSLTFYLLFETKDFFPMYRVSGPGVHQGLQLTEVAGQLWHPEPFTHLHYQRERGTETMAHPASPTQGACWQLSHHLARVRPSSFRY